MSSGRLRSRPPRCSHQPAGQMLQLGRRTRTRRRRVARRCRRCETSRRAARARWLPESFRYPEEETLSGRCGRVANAEFADRPCRRFIVIGVLDDHLEARLAAADRVGFRMTRLDSVERTAPRLGRAPALDEGCRIVREPSIAVPDWRRRPSKSVAHGFFVRRLGLGQQCRHDPPR